MAARARGGQLLRLDNDETIGPRLTRWAWVMKLLFRQPDAVWALARKLDMKATLFMDPATEKLRALQIYALINEIVDELERRWRGGDETASEWDALLQDIDALPPLVPERRELLRRIDACADGISLNSGPKKTLADLLTGLQARSDDMMSDCKAPARIVLFTGASSTGKSWLAQNWLSVLDSPCFEKQEFGAKARAVEKINEKSLDALAGKGIVYWCINDLHRITTGGRFLDFLGDEAGGALKGGSPRFAFSIVVASANWGADPVKKSLATEGGEPWLKKGVSMMAEYPERTPTDEFMRQLAALVEDHYKSSAIYGRFRDGVILFYPLTERERYSFFVSLFLKKLQQLQAREGALVGGFVATRELIAAMWEAFCATARRQDDSFLRAADTYINKCDTNLIRMKAHKCADDKHVYLHAEAGDILAYVDNGGSAASPYRVVARIDLPQAVRPSTGDPWLDWLMWRVRQPRWDVQVGGRRCKLMHPSAPLCGVAEAHLVEGIALDELDQKLGGNRSYGLQMRMDGLGGERLTVRQFFAPLFDRARELGREALDLVEGCLRLDAGTGAWKVGDPRMWREMARRLFPAFEEETQLQDKIRRGMGLRREHAVNIIADFGTQGQVGQMAQGGETKSNGAVEDEAIEDNTNHSPSASSEGGGDSLGGSDEEYEEEDDTDDDDSDGADADAPAAVGGLQDLKQRLLALQMPEAPTAVPTSVPRVAAPVTSPVRRVPAMPVRP
jgi:hypothetical protein